MSGLTIDQALASPDGCAWLSGVVTDDQVVEILDLAERLAPELDRGLTLALCAAAGGTAGWVRARAFAEQLLQAGDRLRRLLPSPEAEAS